MTALVAPGEPLSPPGRPEVAPNDSRQGLSAVGWLSLAQLACMGIRLGSSLVLTRLLAPEAYGILGPALAVLTTLEWFCDLGVRPALVRHPQGATAVYLNAGWWLGLVRGAGIGLVTMGLALPLAHFSAQEELAGVLTALALYPVLQALRSPGLPVLRRELRYRAVFVEEVGQGLAQVAFTLAAAWAWRSVWALVAGMLGGAVVGVLISYLLCPLPPRASWDRLAARQILHVSRQVFLNTLLMALWLNADRILGLRLVSLEEMGLYAVAWNLAGVLDTLLGRACDVHFSLLSRTADPALRAGRHDRVCTRVALAAMPVLLVGALLAPWVVRLLYDPRYAGAGVLLSVLMIRLMLRGLGQVQFQYLLAEADIRLASVSYVVALVAQVGLLVFFAREWGALGLALAGLASTAVLTGLQSLLMWRRGQGQLAPLFITLGWGLLALCLLFWTV